MSSLPLASQDVSSYVFANLTVRNTICMLAFVQLARWIYISFSRISISYLPGPSKTDWLLGNLPDLNFGEVGVAHLAWQKKFGTTFKFHGLIGDQYIMTSDWKAVQHIYANSNIFVRQTQNRELLKMMTGPGLAVVHGEDHKRQRRVMQPAFGIPQIKALFPVLSRHAENLISVMKRDMDGGALRRVARMNVHDYSVRATLDIIGDAAFEYQFGALDNKKDALKEAIHRLDAPANSKRSALFSQFAMERIPAGLVQYLPWLPIKKFALLRATDNILTSIASKLVKSKTEAYEQGLESGKDLMSLLVRANADQDSKSKLSEQEVRAEIATISLAGHGTTANTLAFALWELAKNPDLQRRIRKEISHTLHVVQQQGENEIGFGKYDSMDLLTAFLKEVLRYHPIAFNANRQALADDVIPLSCPIKLANGKVVNQIPISKGQKIYINIPGYNKLSEIFGEDSEEFNVERWLDNKDLINDQNRPQGVGIYANLITFAHGPRACIGWRLALWELQMLLINLLSTFEFSVPEGTSEVFKTASVTMVPTVRGNGEAGTALYLDVALLN